MNQRYKRKQKTDYRGIYSELLQSFDSKSIRNSSNLGPPNKINKRPIQTRHRLKSLPREDLSELIDKNKIQMESRVKTEGQYSSKREELLALEPKLMEPHENAPGDIPRRVIIDRRIKEFQNYSITQELSNFSIDFSKIDTSPEAKLPLELFDDDSYLSRTPEDLMSLAEESNKRKLIPATALFMESDRTGTYKKCVVKDYCKDIQDVFFEELNVNRKVHKIYVVFENDDFRTYAKRMQNAIRQRFLTQQALRQNLWVEKMPIRDTPTLTPAQVFRISNRLASKHNPSPHTHKLSILAINNLKQDQARLQNKFSFKKYYKESMEKIIGEEIPIPDEQSTLKRYKAYGLVRQPNKKSRFFENKSQFEFLTLYISKSVVKAMFEINSSCEKAENKCNLFVFELKEMYTIDEFINSQRTNINNCLFFLNNNWAKELDATIQQHILNMGKGLFNMKEKLKDTFEKSKLRAFLKVLQFRMEKTLNSISQYNLKKYLEVFKSLKPFEVIVNSCTSIKNAQLHQPEWATDHDEVNALFMIKLIENSETNLFEQDTELSKFGKVVLDLYKQGAQVLTQVDLLDRKMLPEIYRNKKVNTKLKAPIMKKIRPIQPTNEERIKGKTADPDLWIQEQYEDLEALLTDSYGPANQFLDFAQKWSKEIALDPEEYFMGVYGVLQEEITQNYGREDEHLQTANTGGVNAAEEDKSQVNQDLKDIKSKIAKQQAIRDEIERTLPWNIKVGIYHIDCAVVKKLLMLKHDKIIYLMKNLIFQLARYNVHEVTKFKDRILSRLGTDVKDIRELHALRKFIEEIPSNLTEMNKMILSAHECFDMLDTYQYDQDEDELQEKLMLRTFAKAIVELKESVEENSEARSKIFLSQLRDEQNLFENEIKEILELVNKITLYKDISKQEDQASNVNELEKRLKQSNDRATDQNEQENMFGITMVNQPIRDITKKFDTQKTLWVTLRDWNHNYYKWMTCAWNTLSGEEVEKEVLTQKTSFNKCKKLYRNDEEQAELVNNIEKYLTDIKNFENQVPLAVNLRVDGMMDRHWKELSERIKLKVHPSSKNFTLKRVIDMGLADHLDVIEDISVKALKEFGIRKDLDRMYREWKQCEFTFTELRNTSDVFIIKNFEDCLNLNDEHIGIATNLQYSPYKAVYDEEINNWKKTLEVVSSVLEKWMKLQISQMQLQPIFTSGDIKKSLQQYYKMFKQVDNRWKQNISHAKRVGQVKDFCDNETLRDTLGEDIVILDKVQKNLENYLTIKRSNFARLYFLSDDELLKILSNTKEPRNINQQLKKIFECMETIIFNDKSHITHMTSKEGEVIPLDKPIDPKEYSVEIWCKSLENMMISTMRTVINNSIEDYELVERRTWVKKWYNQCVLNTTQYFFTQETEKSIIAQDLQQYQIKCNNQILDLVELVRTKLTKLQKKNISPLIVQGVHERDIIGKMEAINVSSVNEFDWICQLRFQIKKTDHDNLIAKCMQTEYPQGYEQMGNADRLVITPLTDKCQMTLMGALKLNLGGAPSGPAGTGKTETTKDLAKNLAKLCKVFNCGPEMEYKMIGTFFKGLASCGAWCCFDEFNRILLEVLSVVAQYLQTLLNEKSKGFEESTIYFLETEIKVQSSFSVFITMNPTQKGRNDLPDNLKALFRPMAMMVPDQKLIAEIFLQSFGFMESTVLAGKLVDTFILCSEQLSYQQHQDQGMRAVRSTINTAGMLKRKNPDGDENEIVLKALIDINLPKFLKQDIQLFNNIISDLFPSTPLPNYSLGKLEDAIHAQLADDQLQESEEFYQKIKQLQDTLQVRVGVMMVGPTGSGKTVNYQTLKNAINRIALNSVDATEEEREENPFRKVETRILNPKSILNDQIQGQMNQITKEQTKGLVPVIFNQAVDEEKTEHLQWIMFDGPVDSLWIESMNSCLDDSKKLCLPNSEIITMTDQFNIMFEVDDLSEASPATISRCGMVQMDPKALHTSQILFNQTKHFPEAMQIDAFILRLQRIFEGCIDTFLFRMRRECKQMVLTSEINYTHSLLNIINCQIVKAKPNEQGEVNQVEVERLIQCTELLFVFAVTWSIGINLDERSRLKFNMIMDDEFSKLNVTLAEEGRPLLPNCPGKNYYDVQMDLYENKFKLWRDLGEKQVFKNMSFEEIVVPTEENMKLMEISSKLTFSNYHVMKCGGTGTGKSLNCDSLIADLPTNKQNTITLTFNARTGVQAIHTTLGPKLKRRKLGVLGPEGNKKAMIFIDDFNMPKKETFGAQPVLELVRQWFDHHGWQDMNEFEFKRVIDIFILVAMGLPGGGRSIISQRIVRHFNVIGQINMNNKSVSQIFNSITEGFFQLNLISDEVRNWVKAMVDATIDFYNEIIKNFLPIPTKSHYVFNLRDLSKIFQGLCLSGTKTMSDVNGFVRLWQHETSRVFKDRLTEKEDCRNFEKMVTATIVNNLSLDPEECINKERILFSEIVEREQELKVQKEVENLSKLQAVLEEILEDQNGEHVPMNLILFSDCCEHINRLCRIIGFPRGNALLMGVGGSGRQSCAKLANYAMNQKLQTIEITKDYKIEKNWRDDVKNCLMQAGSKRLHTTFLIVDTQIIGEKILEDINNILNTADVPNIQTADDLEDMNKVARRDCQDKGIEQTAMNLFNQYLISVKKNIHVVLAMSQMSEKFRANLLNFPSLISCNTIDQFSEWPEDALINVARYQLKDFGMNLGDETEDVVRIFSFVHKSVEITSKRYMEEAKRQNQVTPTSQLELIKMQKRVMVQKNEESDLMIGRQNIGLSIIDESQRKTVELQKKIREEEPKLQDLEVQLTKKNESLKVILDETQKKNDEVIIAAKEQNVKVEQLHEMNSEIAREKADTEKEKDEALKLAEKMSGKDITEINSQLNPSESICYCMKMIVLLFDEEKEVKNRDDLTLWFGVCKNKLLKNVNDFKTRLKERLTSEKITERQQKKIEPFYDKNKFETNQYESISGACVKLAGWVKAMRSIYLTNVKLAPILQKQLEGEKKLNEGTAMLEKLNKDQKECEQKCKDYQENANQCQRQKLETQKNLEMNKTRLVRANKLLSGLKDEKNRWNAEVTRLKGESKYLVGNCVIAAAMLSQGGPFDSIYRQSLVHTWTERLSQTTVKLSKGSSLISVIGNKVKIEAWKGLQGLPNDELSIENSIILDQTSRLPLCIDPQHQASSFIKRSGVDIKNDKFKIMKASDDKIIHEIEQAIKFGKWLMIENVSEKLSTDYDAVLTPVIRSKGKARLIKFGDKEIEQNEEFKLFLVTTLPNPHYSPETCVKICLINFAITEIGLKDQMLSQAVSIEKQELEAERNKLIETNAQNEKRLYEKEDEILEDLKKSNPETILDHDDLINKLYNTKEEANRIKKDQESAKEREEKIRIERNKQVELARKIGILFFILTDLVHIDHMQQQSLTFFKDLFQKAADDADTSTDDEVRIKNIQDTFLRKLQVYVCRTLFEKDKLLFSFNITIKLKIYHKQVDPVQFKYLLTGCTEDVIPTHSPSYIDNLAWNHIYKNIQGFNKFKKLDIFREQFFDNVDRFKKMQLSEDPRVEKFPGNWDSQLDQFQKLLIYKAIRPDFLSACIKDQIRTSMGKHFVDPPLFKIDEGYANSTSDSPIIFIITPGSDPLTDLKKFSEKKMGKDLKQLSLGQGQGKQAYAMFKKFSEDGTWLLYQNTHLYPSWMGSLERIVEEMKKPNIHPEFRLFLTTASSKAFPITILQEGVKMTVETSGDVKQMMLNAYSNYTDEQMESCKPDRVELFKNLLFGITLFHSLLIERKKFGPIGWNNASTYDFSKEDLAVTRDQLKIMIEESDQVDLKVLSYNAAIINQGGRVTDSKDERFIKTFVQRFINEGVTKESGANSTFSFDENGKFKIPGSGQQEDYREQISQNQETITPELFGLHSNAEITTNQSMGEELLAKILSVQPRSAVGESGLSQEDIFDEKANFILERVPNSFDLELLEKKFETSYQESMNTVLTQEAARYNRLIACMLEDLKLFKDAIRGKIVMNDELELMGVSLMNNEVPSNWTEENGVGQRSIKWLSSWINDLRARVAFLREWDEGGTPICFWMSGFFFPQAFLTGIKQNYARKYKIPIDLVKFDFVLMNEISGPNEIVDPAPEGCYIKGLQLEGAAYNTSSGQLVSSKHRELQVSLPILWLKPTDNKEEKVNNNQECPIQKTTARQGQLTTTGHSTNFVMFMDISTERKADYWIMAGVAAFLSLKFD